jgi:hypothetical protein
LSDEHILAIARNGESNYINDPFATPEIYYFMENTSTLDQFLQVIIRKTNDKTIIDLNYVALQFDKSGKKFIDKSGYRNIITQHGSTKTVVWKPLYISPAFGRIIERMETWWRPPSLWDKYKNFILEPTPKRKRNITNYSPLTY